jgi:hypothetical protein
MLRHRMRGARRTATITIGAILGASAISSALLLACNCGPTPRPTMERCDAPTTPTSVTGATLIETRGGTILEDGDRVPVTFGSQGGTHIELLVELEGTGFGACLEQSTSLFDPSGRMIADSRSSVPVDVEGGVARTRKILLFPDEPEPRAALLRVEIAGLTIERRLGTWPTSDASVPDAAISDASSSDASASDASASEASDGSRVDAR